MNKATRTLLDQIHSPDRYEQNLAFHALLDLTEEPVDWAEEAWDELLDGLKSSDNRARSICAQLLCNLVKSDHHAMVMRDFDQLLEVTRDERFVTARHTLQSLWKVGEAGRPQRKLLLHGLEQRYQESTDEKNGTLIRYDILQVMRKVYDQHGEEDIREKALSWIEMEEDEKYRRKYSTLWKDAVPQV